MICARREGSSGTWEHKEAPGPDKGSSPPVGGSPELGLGWIGGRKQRRQCRHFLPAARRGGNGVMPGLKEGPPQDRGCADGRADAEPH